ncbi:MAG TPA: fructose-bisphosphatase class III [Acetivibrio sp.]|jgi:serine/threonine protein phosphatase 1|nr:serine/threonine protein phosphatase [Clostridium sp.]HOQ36748.1 fructose-bisphosphatase class III [Acetivibrio sp.]HPT91942.1 fructose-bisphosphatase class III [Acetivibrio sp.]HQA57680.1 fructose-bisphosphatase class III [Acetivibrio sp.]
MFYLMSDLHGEFQKFLNMLDEIQFGSSDQLIILGDVIDRGPESIPLLQYIMEHNNMELLLGNHEEMLLKSLINEDEEYYLCWMGNGGISTLSQLDLLSQEEQIDIIKYLRNCSMYKILDNYILSHAGVDTSLYTNGSNIEEFMRKQNSEYLLWKQDFFHSRSLDKYTVIFGHVPTYYLNGDRSLNIWHGKNKIGIDCGACYFGGKLSCLRLDDMKEFYV